jgi:hypothetical protein
LVYDNQSMLKDVEPYTFPDLLFYLIPGTFFLAAIILLLIALIPSLKRYNLYKFGDVKNAVIVSVGFNNGIIGFSNFTGKLTVNYYFINRHQNKVFGEAELNDYLLIGKNIGDTIKIFVSEKDENKSCLIPNIEAIKNNWDLGIPQVA